MIVFKMLHEEVLQPTKSFGAAEAVGDITLIRNVRSLPDNVIKKYQH